MSARHKNAKRLVRLRWHGVPINGDYCLTAAYMGAPKGTRVTLEQQKAFLKERMA